MRTRVALPVWVLGSLLCVAGCRQPSLEIVVRAPAGYDLDDVTLDLRVYAPGNIEEVNCDGLSFGEMSVDELNAALVLAQPLDEAGVVADFPVSTDKLIVVEGRDGDAELAFRGCTQLGGFGRNSTVVVELSPAVRLLADVEELLEGTVGESLPPLRVSALDYRGIAVAGADVRGQLVGPGAALIAETVVASGEAGGVQLDLTPTVGGPFRLALRARVERGAPAPSTPGFALPRDTLVDPFARPGQSWVYVTPTRLGDDVGYVGRTATVLPEVVVVTANGAGGFDPTPVDAGLATVFLGSLTDDDGLPWLVFSAQRTGLGLRFASTAGDVVDRGFGGQRYEVGRAVPAGDCVDDQRGPAVMALRLVDVEADEGLSASPTHLALIGPDMEPIVVDQMGEATEPLFSVCREVEGTLWRVVVVRQRGRIGLVAIAGGVTDQPSLASLTDRRSGLPGALLAGPVTAGDAHLVTARLAGFRSVVELQRTEISAGGEIRMTPQPLFDVPAVPSTLSAAAVLGDAQPEVVGLLATGQGGLERGLLMMGARTSDVDTWTVGAVALQACEGTTCALVLHDVDDDGEDELFVGMGIRAAADPQPDAIAQVIDLSP